MHLMESIWDNVWGILPNRIIFVSLFPTLLATFLRFLGDVAPNGLLYRALIRVVSAFRWLIEQIPTLAHKLLRKLLRSTKAQPKKGRFVLARAAVSPVTQQAAASQRLDAWQAWIVPLTGAGSVLGIILTAHADPLFADLSLLFGALIFISPLAVVSENHPYLATLLLAWGVFGELLTVWVVSPAADKTSVAITVGLRVLIVLAALLAFGYTVSNSEAPAQEKAPAMALARKPAEPSDPKQPPGDEGHIP